MVQDVATDSLPLCRWPAESIMCWTKSSVICYTSNQSTGICATVLDQCWCPWTDNFPFLHGLVF